MQKKTISKEIRNKLNDWLSTINDANLVKELKDNIIVSGGSIASMLLNEPVNDYDIYIKEKTCLLKLVKYYTDPFAKFIFILDGEFKQKLLDENFRSGQYSVSLNNLRENQVKMFIEGGAGYRTEPIEGKKYQPLYFSPNAISLSDDIQIVVRFYGEPNEVHKTFDFIHATNYFTFNDGVVLNLPAMESLMSKQLKYQGSLYPLTSIIRARKFIKRNWNIGAGEYLKIMFQISELDLKNINILEEQLIGVDVAYFAELIEALRNKYEKEPDFDLSSVYLVALIEKIFDSDGE